MIELQQETSGLPRINHEILEKAIFIALSLHNKPELDITLRLTTDKEMRSMNKAYRGIDKTTDVLAFNQDFVDPQTSRMYLGDIIISVDRASEQALENNQSLDEECALLAIHGTLHLLGYDHVKPAQKVLMWEKQGEILNRLREHFPEDSE